MRLAKFYFPLFALLSILAFSVEAGTRVIMGFEKDDMVKEWSPSATGGSGVYPGRYGVLPADSAWIKGDSVGWNLYLDSTQKTEGSWSRVYPLIPTIWSFFRITDKCFSFQPESFENSFAGLVTKNVVYDDFYASVPWRMTGTFYHFPIDSLPGGHDWRGFNKLRMDIKTGAQTVIQMEIGDNTIWPLIKRTFSVPAGEWRTLEVDLDSCVAVRGLDLMDMMDCWIRLVSAASPTFVYYDNVRLETADITPVLSSIIDTSTYSIPLPIPRYAGKVDTSLEGMEGRGKFPYKTFIDATAIPNDPAPPAKIYGSPVGIGTTSEITTGDPANMVSWPKNRELLPVAYDKNRMAIMFITSDGNPNVTWISCSVDGGVTWTGTDGDPAPTCLGAKSDDTYGGNGVSQDGSELHRIPLFGCAHYAHPTDRGFINKVQLTTEGWKRQSVWLPVPYELRHCSEHIQSIRLTSGRIWTTTCGQGPFRTDANPTWIVAEQNDLFAMYSDDGGKSWRSWRHGFTSRVNDLPLTISGTYGDKNLMAPFGDHIAAYTNSRFWIFNGTSWDQPFTDAQYPSCLHSTADGKTLLWTRNNVKLGKYTLAGGMSSETLPGNTIKYGKLGQTGDKMIHVAQSGDKLALLCWYRGLDGIWTGPDTLVKDTANGIHDFVITKYAPAEYFILAYSISNTPGKFYVKIVPTTGGATSAHQPPPLPSGNAVDLNVMTNPFKNRAEIQLRLPAEQIVSLDIYHVSGKLIKSLVSKEVKSAGLHHVFWDGTTRNGNKAAIGTYFIRLTCPERVMESRIALIR